MTAPIRLSFVPASANFVLEREHADRDVIRTSVGAKAGDIAFIVDQTDGTITWGILRECVDEMLWHWKWDVLDDHALADVLAERVGHKIESLPNMEELLMQSVGFTPELHKKMH